MGKKKQNHYEENSDKYPTLEAHPHYRSIIRKQRMCLLVLAQAKASITNQEVDDVAGTIIIQDVKQCKAEFDSSQTELLDLLDQVEDDAVNKGEDQLVQSQEAVNERCQNVLTQVNAIIRKSYANSTQTKPGVINPETNSDHYQTRYPKIEVPAFDGNIRKFQEFIGLYDDLVHNVSTLPKVRKLHYLKIALKAGKAYVLIRDTSLTDEAYDEVYERLRRRYHNKRAVINAHLSDLFAVERINGTEGLRKLLDTFTGAVSGLKVSGIDVC